MAQASSTGPHQQQKNRAIVQQTGSPVIIKKIAALEVLEVFCCGFRTSRLLQLDFPGNWDERPVKVPKYSAILRSGARATRLLILADFSLHCLSDLDHVFIGMSTSHRNNARRN